MTWRKGLYASSSWEQFSCWITEKIKSPFLFKTNPDNINTSNRHWILIFIEQKFSWTYYILLVAIILCLLRLSSWHTFESNYEPLTRTWFYQSCTYEQFLEPVDHLDLDLLAVNIWTAKPSSTKPTANCRSLYYIVFASYWSYFQVTSSVYIWTFNYSYPLCDLDFIFMLASNQTN